jgi:hypothetical protein
MRRAGKLGRQAGVGNPQRERDLFEQFGYGFLERRSDRLRVTSFVKQQVDLRILTSIFYGKSALAVGC